MENNISNSDKYKGKYRIRPVRTVLRGGKQSVFTKWNR
jgi:hypothetical protein